MSLILVGLALAGAATWTLAEYGIHRVLGHDARTRPNFFSKEHTRHHSEGDYFAPTKKKLRAAAAIVTVALPFGALAFGLLPTAAFFFGFLACYAAYEIVHRRAHTHEGIGRYGRYLRRHHFHHHFENPRANHGVTTPVWDVVFGTYERAEQVRVPERLTMCWLQDPKTGGVRSAFADRYTIVPLRRA